MKRPCCKGQDSHIAKNKAAPLVAEKKSDADENRRLCGNCGVRGHLNQAVTCAAPCFVCGGNHEYVIDF